MEPSRLTAGRTGADGAWSMAQRVVSVGVARAPGGHRLPPSARWSEDDICSTTAWQLAASLDCRLSLAGLWVLLGTLELEKPRPLDLFHPLCRSVPYFCHAAARVCRLSAVWTGMRGYRGLGIENPPAPIAATLAEWSMI